MNEDLVAAEKSAPAPVDAVDQLVADHQTVKSHFEQFETLKASGASPEEKGALVEKIVQELKVHETVENEVFFPNVRSVLRKESLTLEVESEQEDATDAIAQLGELNPTDPDFDSQVSTLGQKIAAHAAEEESDVFPSVKSSTIDTTSLGEEMLERKAELGKQLVGVPLTKGGNFDGGRGTLAKSTCPADQSNEESRVAGSFDCQIEQRTPVSLLLI